MDGTEREAHPDDLYAECPGCGEKILTMNNTEVFCDKCETTFVFVDESKLSMWD